jgi:hypothetical protein
LSPFGVHDELDLRTNPFQEEGNDEGRASTKSWNAEISKCFKWADSRDFGSSKHVEAH